MCKICFATTFLGQFYHPSTNSAVPMGAFVTTFLNLQTMSSSSMYFLNLDGKNNSILHLLANLSTLSFSLPTKRWLIAWQWDFSILFRVNENIRFFEDANLFLKYTRWLRCGRLIHYHAKSDRLSFITYFFSVLYFTICVFVTCILYMPIYLIWLLLSVPLSLLKYNHLHLQHFPKDRTSIRDKEEVWWVSIIFIYPDLSCQLGIVNCWWFETFVWTFWIIMISYILLQSLRNHSQMDCLHES